MQDIHSIGGGRTLISGGGGGGGGDRRLRPQHQQNNKELKCPRCDSLNTKFCYYNNYNLSQPRHFCKSCRRYWTKGGVLRNVPIGGGYRKVKRSENKLLSESPTVAAAASTPSQHQHRDQREANSHSSSESSCLIAANSNFAVTNNDKSCTCGTAEAASAVTSHPNKVNVSESELYGNPNNVVYEQGSQSEIFLEIGNFSSLVTPSNNETTSFGFFNGLGQWQQQKIEEITGGLLDHTEHVELSNLHSRSESGFGPWDWQESGDQQSFDLPYDVDQTYWNQSQWIDQDHPTHYLPL